MKRVYGFSLMEMMVVLLIVAVVAAATAPMVNKKVSSSKESQSYWVAFNNKGIGYDLLGTGKTVAIGTSSIPNQVNSNLYLNRNNSTPHNIIFDTDGGDKVYMTTSPNIWLSTNPYEWGRDSVIIGRGASSNASNAVVLGDGTVATNNNGIIVIGKSAKVAANDSTNSVVIGCSANSSSKASIAIGELSSVTTGGNGTAVGSSTSVYGANGTAIGANAIANTGASALGYNATASGSSSVAIGRSAQAQYESSVAIGAEAKATHGGEIRIGIDTNSVVIPGTVVLGSKNHPVWVWDPTSQKYALLYNSTGGSGSQTWYTSTNRAANIGTILSSDRRLKNVGKLYSSGLEQIKKLTIYNYTFKDDEGKTPRVGVMAQDLQQIFPSAVTKGEDGFLRIRMEDMFYAVINAVKENDKRLSRLEKENKELLKRIEALEKKK